MQGSGNLTVSIGADAGRLVAEIEKAKASLSSLSKEMTRLRNEAAKSGDWSAVEKAAPALAAARLQARGLQRSFNDLNKTTAETSDSFADLGKQLGGFAKASGFAIGGIKALRYGLAGMVGAQVIRGFTDIVDKITEIGRLSRESGFSTDTIQQWDLAVRKAGGTSEDAAGAIRKLGAAFTEARAKASYTQFGAQFEDDPFKALNIDIQRFKSGAAGLDQLLQTVAQRLVALNNAGKIDEANYRSVQLLGKNYTELASAIQLAASGDLSKLKAQITPQDVAAVKAYNDAIIGLQTAWTDFLHILAETGVFDAVGAAVQAVTKIIEDTAREIRDLFAFIQRADAYIAAKAPLGGTRDGADYGGGGELLRASGGYVSGPGTGTSDSIPARLSNGEFVMRAAAVRAWGVPLMARLNAMRSPVPPLARGRRGFADGGLVQARTADGAIVNLVFPGGTFGLRGDAEIVAGLTREARRAGMLNGGRMAGAFS